MTAFSAERLSEHTKILASDAFEGRAPGTKGEELTVAYLTENFKKLRLEPAFNGEWTQPVRLRRTEVTHSELTFTASSARFPLVALEDYAIRSVAAPGPLMLNDVPIVFVGYGISAPDVGWDDFKGADLTGKVAVILTSDPDAEAGGPGRFARGEQYCSRWTYKVEEAGRRGAVAALIVHEDAPATYGWDVVRNSFSLPSYALATSAEPRCSLEAWLHLRVAEKIFAAGGREFAQLKMLAKRDDFAPIAMDALTFTAEMRVESSELTSSNVGGLLRGGRRPDEVVVYGAHWDHLGVAADPAGRQIFHGALDNASAIAGVLELARRFSHAAPPDRSVLFLAFTAEEKGLLGSEYYVNHPIVPLEQTRGVFNMEVMGSTGPARDLMLWGKPPSTLPAVLATAAAACGRRVSDDPDLQAGYFFRSDHFPFARRGVPAVTICSGEDAYDGGYAAGHAARTRYFRDRYHRPEDAWSPELDFRGVVLDLDVLYHAGLDLSTSP